MQPPDPQLLDNFKNAGRTIEQKAEIVLGSLMAQPLSR